MEPLERHDGTAMPLRRSNIDTDQIAPARYVPYFRPGGFTNILFADWRADPEFVLNQPQYQGATILVAGTDFGTGSSRESAVWALQAAGFRVVVAPRFGDIFRDNALMRGLLPVVLPAELVHRLWMLVEADPWQHLTVDLDRCELTCSEFSHPFPIDPSARAALRSGQDPVARTLAFARAVDRHEQQRRPALPRTCDPQGAFTTGGTT